ncbi:MAG: DNA polymerase [bacterium]|nr:MAG: DNA polymerase [bacterium]
MSLNEPDAYIALNSLTGIGVANFGNLLGRFGYAANVFKMAVSSLREVKGIGPITADQITSCRPQKTADAEKRKAQKLKVRIITALDEGYPQNLKTLHASPPLLYVAGEIMETDAIAVGVVGTRRPTAYGRISTENLSAMLAAMGFTIVSGLARGVDSFAHRAALEAGGRTIAVLGCGLDLCYPPENRGLSEKIRENGAVVSQFCFGTEPEKRNFPVRNRVISGLSLGVLVTEAGTKSGALITAYAALDEGREVFAIPGRIDYAQSVGTNGLIQKGAKLVKNLEDIVEEFPVEVVSYLSLSEESEQHALSGDEVKLLALLAEDERHIDHLINGSGLPSGVVLGILLELEIKGVVRQLPGKLFAKLK